jgi:hypothetical protein
VDHAGESVRAFGALDILCITGFTGITGITASSR